MRFDQRFEMILPPLTETSAHDWTRPCRRERSMLTGTLPNCPRPFEDNCQTIAGLPLFMRLEAVYGQWIRATHVETSSCIVVRSEHLFSQVDRHRFSIRKHFYELKPGLDAKPARTPPCFGPAALGCYDLARGDQTDEFRMYLGFMDLRPEPWRSAIAFALLVPPKHLRQCPQTSIMCGCFGPLFGATGFPCTVFSAQDPRIGGSVCCHAAMIMALSMLGDRRSRLHGSYSLTYLGPKKAIEFLGQEPRLAKEQQEEQQEEQRLVENAQGGITEFYEITGGLHTKGISAVLGEPACNVSPFNFSIRFGELSERVAVRLIECFVLARFPVVLAVDCDYWWWPDEKWTKEGHSVVVVGVRHDPRGDFRKTVFVVHDPGHQPYVERLASDCLEASRLASTRKKPPSPFPDVAGEQGEEKVDPRKFKVAREALLRANTHWRQSSAVRFAGVADRGLERDLQACLINLANHPRHGPQFRQFAADDAAAGFDLVVRLVWLADLADALFPPGMDRRVKAKVQEAVQIGERRPSPGRYWMVAGMQDGFPRHAWIFEADQAEAELPYLGWHLDFEVPRKFTLEKIPRQGFLDRLRAMLSSFRKWARKLSGQVRGTALVPAKVAQAAKIKYLKPSVITSCTRLPLRDFVYEVSKVDQVDRFDLFLRDVDIAQMVRTGDLSALPDGKLPSATQVLANDANCERVGRWWAEQLREGSDGRARVSAFATYFPQVTRIDDDPAQEKKGDAIKALGNFIRVGKALKRMGLLASDKIIVEVVCGTILDRCRRDEARRVFVSSRESKLGLLIASLGEALRSVGDYSDCAIGLELEPGLVYVLRDESDIELIPRMLRQHGLEKFVGLNLDIAHYRIADILASELAPYRNLIVNGHIADHPYFHSRDQAVGSWTATMVGSASDYLPFLELLDARCGSLGAGLPFSGSVAVELEGCDRMSWIHSSLSELKRMLG